MDSGSRRCKTQRVGHKGRGGIAVQVFTEKDQFAIAGPQDLHADIGSDEGRGMGLSQVLPAGVVDEVGVGRIGFDAMWGRSDEGKLTSEVELADAYLVSRSHGFGVSLSRRFSRGDGLHRSSSGKCR